MKLKEIIGILCLNCAVTLMVLIICDLIPTTVKYWYIPGATSTIYNNEMFLPAIIAAFGLGIVGITFFVYKRVGDM